MKIKQILLTTMILLVAFTTSACNETKKVTKPIDIHFQVPIPKSNDPAFNSFEKPYLDAVANFHKLNPLINVIIDYNTESMYLVDKSIKLLESNEPPDIVPLPPSQISIAEKKGLLQDLLQLQKSSASNEIDIYQGILDSGMIDGKLLVLPYSAYPSAVIYNKDLFDSAHIPYPQGDWTWEQFRDISKKLKLTGGGVLSYDTFTLGLLMASTGKGLLSPNGDTSVGYLDSPEAIRTLQWLNAYYHDEEQTTPLNTMDLFQQFDNQQIGMFIGNVSLRFHNFEGSNRVKLGVAPFPHFEGGKRANPIFFDGYAISQKSKHPEAAWEFIKYLTLTKNEDAVRFANNFLTTSKTVAEAAGQNSDPIKSIYSDEMNYAVRSSFSNPYFYKAWTGDLTTQFENLLSAKSNDIPAKLHDLALKLDQELNRLKQAEDQPTVSPSP
jgi:multiple sugar transport system substrate-binding protein